MKCAILLNALCVGGAERVAINLANGFRENGLEVDLVVAADVGDGADELDREIPVIALGAGRARKAVLPFRRYLKAGRPDVVLPITYEMNLVAGLAVLDMKPRPRLLLTVHGPLQRFDAAPALWSRTAMYLSRRIYRQADCVIGVSRGIADELQSEGWVKPDRVRTIHNPVISDAMLLLADAPLPSGLRRDPSTPAIVTVGRLHPVKNHPLLLDAFTRVLDVRPAQLWIVGEGPYRAEIEERIERLALAGSVQLLGEVANPYPIIKAADLLVLSSNLEGFGNVLVEAMALGTPVVSTDCPYGPREILEGGKWGTLVPPRDARALAGAMLSALEHGRIDARERARDFTVERAVGEYVSLIRSVVS